MTVNIQRADWNVISAAQRLVFTHGSCTVTEKMACTWEIIFSEKGLVTIDNSGRGTRKLKYPRIIAPARQRCNPFIIHIHKHLDLGNSSGSQSNEYEFNLHEAAWAVRWTTPGGEIGEARHRLSTSSAYRVTGEARRPILVYFNHNLPAFYVLRRVQLKFKWKGHYHTSGTLQIIAKKLMRVQIHNRDKAKQFSVSLSS